MLKLTYIESGLHLERVAAPLEVLVAQRVLLAIRAGQCLHVEPGQASFLIARDAPGLAQLEKTLQRENQPSVTLIPVDDEFMEITVQGSWLAESAIAEEGVFLTSLSHASEFLVARLWEVTQTQVSYLA